MRGATAAAAIVHARAAAKSAAPICCLPATVSQLLALPRGGERHVVAHGWVDSIRRLRERTFIAIVDGTSCRSLQLVVATDELPAALRLGTALSASGILQPAPPAHAAPLELLVESNGLCVLANVSEASPFKRGDVTKRIFRSNVHLRPRNPHFATVLRIRHELLRLIHAFFDGNDFLYVTTPVITSSDCEGAGETFSVAPPKKAPDFFSSLKDESGKTVATSPVLSVSAQLHLEAFAGAHPRVYTISSCFRAESARDARHLAEFLMLEVELGFATCVSTLTSVLKDLLAYLAAELESKIQSDHDFLCTESRSEILLNLQKMRLLNSKEITFKQAVALLNSDLIIKKENNDPSVVVAAAKAATTTIASPSCGVISSHRGLSSESERLLAAHFGVPLFITHYPRESKPFYMLPTACGKHAENFDLLLPGVGEVSGGSLRQHSTEALAQQMSDAGISSTNLDWYVDLRRHACGPHGGFGLGIDRLLCFITGVSSIRDVVPVPRVYHDCKL